MTPKAGAFELNTLSPEEKNMTRSEYLEWCKKRALEYIDTGNINDAYTSMASDLSKHPETEGHSAIGLGMQMLMAGHLSSADKMRKFILGFN